jgi:tocopherol cyclase
MLYLLKKLYRPEFFQGDAVLRRYQRGESHTPGLRPRSAKRPRGYFEGWYFKCVFPGRALALIPGVSLEPADPHCFVQVLDSAAGPSRYHRYPWTEFRFDSKRFEIQVGPNRFSGQGIQLDLEGLRGELTISDGVRWPSSLLSPSSMGWYAFARFMECYHGVILLDASVRGRLGTGAPAEGRLYVEKDWGSSFPRAWIWMQSNSFGGDLPASLTCSIARVPFRGQEFSGFIVGVLVGGILYRFATYNGARIESLGIEESSLEVRLRRGRQSLVLRATREQGVELASPILGAMSGRIEETLGATIEIRLSEDGVSRFAGTGRSAGLEVVRAEELQRGREATSQ